MDQFEKLQKTIVNIQSQSSHVYIVNAGRMNHGKSSLFNSLLDNESFATGDIRTTVESKNVKFAEGVYLIDTPGLDAEKNDDVSAFEAYKRASMIIFVHTLNVGELHKDEIERIIQIAGLFPSRDYFWKHFCLVLTFSESMDADHANLIKEKILKDVKEKCGNYQFPVFLVSNIRYSKGKKEDKKNLVKKSGVEELKTFLNTNIDIWKKEIKSLNEERIKNVVQKEIDKLKVQKAISQKAYDMKTNQAESNVIRIENILIQVCESLADENSLKKRKLSTLQRAENELSNLKSRHASDRRYY